MGPIRLQSTRAHVHVAYVDQLTSLFLSPLFTPFDRSVTDNLPSLSPLLLLHFFFLITLANSYLENENYSEFQFLKILNFIVQAICFFSNARNTENLKNFIITCYMANCEWWKIVGLHLHHL